MTTKAKIKKAPAKAAASATATNDQTGATATVKTIEPTPTVQPLEPAKAKTLYEISKEYSELTDLLSGIEGDITPENQQQIDAFLSGLDEDRDKKIDVYCGLIRDLQARGEARDKEAKRFSQLAKWDTNKADRLKAVLLNFLQLHNVERLETVRFRLRRAANAARPVILGARFLEHPEDLPERFRLTNFKANLKEISQALKDGEKLDFASFGEKAENLRIE